MYLTLGTSKKNVLDSLFHLISHLLFEHLQVFHLFMISLPPFSHLWNFFLPLRVHTQDPSLKGPHTPIFMKAGVVASFCEPRAVPCLWPSVDYGTSLDAVSCPSLGNKFLEEFLAVV